MIGANRTAPAITATALTAADMTNVERISCVIGFFTFRFAEVYLTRAALDQQ
jgi:hypothetical protein